MADHPLRPATDHRLGRPLPHQPANRPQVPRAPIRRSFLTNPTRSASVSGITHRFRWLPPCARQLPHAFLTRPPRERPEGRPVRLACIRHAASVDPEPGSNSPPSAYFLTTPPGRHRLDRDAAFFKCVVLGVTWATCRPGHQTRPVPSAARARRQDRPVPLPAQQAVCSVFRTRITLPAPSPATCQCAGSLTWNHPALRGAITPNDPPCRPGLRSWLFPVPPWQ